MGDLWDKSFSVNLDNYSSTMEHVAYGYSKPMLVGSRVVAKGVLAI